LNNESIGACFSRARFGRTSRFRRLLEIALLFVLAEPHQQLI
jgi:hypothetical protein